MIVWQAFLGVGMALVYNILLFACMDVHTQDKNADDPYDGYTEIKQAFSSSTYWVYLHDFYTALPWMIVFTVVVLVCPFAGTTKKFAVANNLYFILENAYLCSAIHRLRENTKLAADDILELLNIIVDSYCFKNKNVEHMNFLKLKLQRKFDAAAARHRRMQDLLTDAWWEQSFGFHYALGFHRPIMFNYVKLVGSLISDLRTLSYAMQLEKYEHLHFTYMKVLQREIYIIQTRSGDLLNEIAREVQSASRGKCATFGSQSPFVFNELTFLLMVLQSTMIDFQDIHNKKNYTDAHRIRSFLLTSAKDFFQKHHYTDGHSMLAAFRGSLAIVLGIFLSVYVYGYNATVPSTVAYVMGNYLGGSFSVTVNRVGGVVAGSVVPSVFQFFIAQICDPQYLNVVLSNIVLFVWIFISMYVCYVGGYSSYAGLVSAFVSTGILMRQSDLCYASATDNASSIAISSYSSLAQTSVGIVLFIIVELMMCPKSATNLLRRNIQKTLTLQLEAFEVLFGHHLTSSSTMDATTMEHLREILQVKIPAKHLEQAILLAEAQKEPLMWRPAFSVQKYEKVLESSRRLLNNNTLLLKLVRWFNYRVEHNRVHLNSIDIRDSLTAARPSNDGKSTTHAQWQLAAGQFQSAVTDSFNTLQMLFGDSFLYSDPDQTAIFMQMKEAFRLADKDCSGEIDADEVADMLETIFAQSGAVKQGEIHKYVEEFMRVVDKDKSGMVSFEEFMEALENGLKLEVEVYTRRKPKAPALLARRENALPCIDEDGVDGESESDVAKGGDEKAVHPRGNIQLKAPLTAETIVAHEAKVNNSRAAMPSHEGYRRSSQASSIERGRKASSAASSSPAMCREHDVLNVEDFSSSDIAAQMKTAYVEWLLEDRRYLTKPNNTFFDETMTTPPLTFGPQAAVSQRLSSLEVLDINPDLLHHALVEFGAVSEWEQDLQQHEHRGGDQSLVQTVKQRRFAALKDSVANELQDPRRCMDRQSHVHAVHVHGLGALHHKVVGEEEAARDDGGAQRARVDVQGHVPQHVDGGHDGRVVEQRVLAEGQRGQRLGRLGQRLRVREDHEPRHEDGPDAGQVDVLVDLVVVVRQADKIPDRRALDEGAVNENSAYWVHIAKAYNEDTINYNNFVLGYSASRYDGIAASCAVPHCATKLRDMWKETMARYDKALHSSRKSGSHGEFWGYCSEHEDALYLADWLKVRGSSVDTVLGLLPPASARISTLVHDTVMSDTSSQGLKPMPGVLRQRSSSSLKPGDARAEVPQKDSIKPENGVVATDLHVALETLGVAEVTARLSAAFVAAVYERVELLDQISAGRIDPLIPAAFWSGSNENERVVWRTPTALGLEMALIKPTEGNQGT
ncbi:unnamed protein product [Phytophthora lilii]|uniref:Unnamed protein product n=1 Tax=Phytophthora lilii TaxID=2077276 RepID=A0A9W6TDK4_9STRA|nr:unnamed protein product [Phytophthora lilii]